MTDINSSKSNASGEQPRGNESGTASAVSADPVVVPETAVSVDSPEALSKEPTERSPDPQQETTEQATEQLMQIGPIQEKRSADSDRRSSDRRRSARGLFEILARRTQVDRRRLDRRGTAGRFRLAFWRRPDSE